MGATAISRVMRSDSMRRSTSSRSNRAWSRTVAPASTAASRFSSPRMCDGGVATWNRSSGPSPRAATQWSVARPSEAWVWRTALGRPVVPELNTRTASSSTVDRRTARPVRSAATESASTGGRVVEVGHRVGAEAVGQEGDGRSVGHGVDAAR